MAGCVHKIEAETFFILILQEDLEWDGPDGHLAALLREKTISDFSLREATLWLLMRCLDQQIAQRSLSMVQVA